MASPVFVELRATTTEFMSKMGEARAEVEKLSTKGGGNFQKLAAVGKAALLGIAGAAIGLGTVSIEMADKFETSHAKLEAALKGAGSNFDAMKSKVDTLDKSFEKYGYTNADTEAGLASMTIATGNPTKALGLMGLAADLAKFKNVDLATAAVAVAKAQEGQLRPLKQLGIDLPVAAGGAKAVAQANTQLSTATTKLTTFLTAHKDAVNTASKYHLTYMQMLDKVHLAQEHVNAVSGAGSSIMAALSKAISGQAAASADTFAGKTQALKAQLEDVSAKIGLALIPVIMKLATVTMNVINWFEKHSEVAKILAIAVGSVLVTAIGAFIVSLVTATVAIGETEIALAPIVLVIAAVGVAIYELYTHWRDIWNGIKTATSATVGFLISLFDSLKVPFVAMGAAAVAVFHAMSTAFGAAIDFIIAHAKLILAILFPVVGLAIDAIWTHWSSIWGAVKTVFHAVMSAVKLYVDTILLPELRLIATVVTWLYANVWSPMWHAISATVGVAWGGMKAAFGFIANLGISVLQSAISDFESVWSGVWSLVAGAVSWVWDVIQPVLNLIKQAISDTLAPIKDVVNTVGKIGGAVGGAASSAGKAVGGFFGLHDEGGILPLGASLVMNKTGKPEAVLNSEQWNTMHTLAKNGGGGGGDLHVALMLDGQKLGDVVLKNFRQQKARGVTLGIA